MTTARLLAAALALCSLPAVAQTPPAQTPPAPATSAADWRAVDPENTLVIDTSQGRIIAELSPAAAPAHVERIKALTRRGFYDGLSFFRVIDRFMAQTGDPQNTGEGGSDLPDLKAEFTFRRPAADPGFVRVAQPAGAEVGMMGALPVQSQPVALGALTADGRVQAFGLFCPGVLGMARATPPDSANSQFFFMRQAYPSLDKNYTAFGRVVSGLPAVRAIKTGEPVAEPRDRMTRVRLLADLPPAERPRVEVQDVRGPAFQAALERARAAKGADFSVCDLEPAARVTGPGA